MLSKNLQTNQKSKPKNRQLTLANNTKFFRRKPLDAKK